MIKNCPICGKAFDVLYPDWWRYVRNNRFLCSWSCIRKYDKDGKEATQVKKTETVKRPRMSRDDMQEAVRMWREDDAGLDQYLMDHGVNDVIKWKRNAKIRYGKEPAACVKVDGPIRIETKEPEKIELVGRDYDIVAMEEELKFNERTTVTAIRVEGLGEFYFDKKYNSVDWRAESGDEVSLGPAWWIQLVEDLPLILKKLGVKL